jgi:hypothetical protein
MENAGLRLRAFELLDAQSVAGQLLRAVSVFAFPAAYRRKLFRDAILTDLFPTGRRAARCAVKSGLDWAHFGRTSAQPRQSQRITVNVIPQFAVGSTLRAGSVQQFNPDRWLHTTVAFTCANSYGCARARMFESVSVSRACHNPLQSGSGRLQRIVLACT